MKAIDYCLLREGDSVSLRDEILHTLLRVCVYVCVCVRMCMCECVYVIIKEEIMNLGGRRNWRGKGIGMM